MKTAWIPVTVTFLLSLSLAGGIAAQERSLPVEPAPPAEGIDVPSRVLDLNDAAARDMLRATLAGNLAEASLDDVYILARWKSVLALPIVEEALASSHPPEPTGGTRVQILLDLVSYAADSRTVEILARLAGESPDLATGALEAALDYAWGRGTAFRLAYVAFDQGRQPLVTTTTLWVRERMAAGHGIEQWAAVLRERQSRPGALTPEHDPMVRAVFGDQVPPELLRIAGGPESPR